MYNLDVLGNDNFFVGEKGWLVHNAGLGCDPRNLSGIVSGRGSSNFAGIMRSSTRFMEIPPEIAQKLAGRSFNTFDDLREAFWREVGGSKYASEFSAANQTRMAGGYAPIAPQASWY